MVSAAAADKRGAWCLTKSAKHAARKEFELYVLLSDADEKVVPAYLPKLPVGETTLFVTRALRVARM